MKYKGKRENCEIEKLEKKSFVSDIVEIYQDKIFEKYIFIYLTKCAQYK